MKFKIKRFLKRNFKRILRCIIIFGVFSCFTIYSFAANYNDFSSFMAGSSANGYLYDESGYISDTITIEDMGDYDHIYIHSPGEGFGGTLDYLWFGGVELRYTNGINYSLPYVRGDYIYLEQQLYIVTYQPADITGILGDFSLDLADTSIKVYTTDDNGSTHVGNYVGRTFVKSITYDEWSDDVGTYYKAMLVDISLKQPLPEEGTDIYGITYVFPSMFAGESIYFNLQPSNSSPVIFFVGDPATMPTYPDFSGNPTLVEEEQFTRSLRTDFQARFVQGFADIATTTGNVIAYRPFNNGIVAASSMINEFLFDVDTYEDIVFGSTMIRNLLWISLTIGLCVFVLNIGVPLAVRAFRNTKKGGD